MDLIARQKELQEEGNKILEKLELIEILSNVGSPNIVGSYVLGLMTWRDIDIEVVVEQAEKGKVKEVCSSLLSKDLRRISFTFIDNTDRKDENLPKGFYIGLKYLDSNEMVSFRNNQNVWKIDIWFVEIEFAQGTEKTKEIKEKLTEENRKIILELKNNVAANPKYRKEIFSTDIYNAVFQNGVKNLEEFNKYLESIGKNLQS